jgi:hypothetical protein
MMPASIGHIIESEARAARSLPPVVIFARRFGPAGAGAAAGETWHYSPGVVPAWTCGERVMLAAAVRRALFWGAATAARAAA